MLYENQDCPTLPLDGEWEFRLGDSAPRPMPVPSAWEAHVSDKVADGPALYRRSFTLPESWSGSRIMLEADAISFDATIRVNGQTAGSHRGMWSPFQCDITELVRFGENVLEIEAWKPGRRFPIRETLAGFLPDVATAFGGIWQSIRLRAFAWAALSGLRVMANGGGWVDVQGSVALMGERRKIDVGVELMDWANRRVARLRVPLAADGTFAAHLEAGRVSSWTPAPGAPLYLVRVSILVRDAQVAHTARRIGFRTLAAVDGQTLLNSSPLQFRGVLDWGWDATRICPTPARDEVQDRIAKARALGFNMIKLCLFVPDEVTFEVADEAGMLLWLEMPMWLPRVTPALRDLARREYAEVFQRLHHHPSLAILSLGCELNAQADEDFLHDLVRLARFWFPQALICDNSGSAEAYGGVTTHFSDFYDYHFYTDPHFFQPLVHHFARLYRANKPWIYGEFCDADTLRDFGQVQPEPWWLAEPTALDRDDFTAMRDYKARLRAAGIADGAASLTRAARQQASAVRKFIIEQVRAHNATGGYVVTGWSDTPITTSGVVDDRGQLKFAPEVWQQFNADRVLTIDRERRRRWVGGDRPAHKDPFTWWQGENAEIHLLLSNGLESLDGVLLQWQLSDAGGAELAGGAADVRQVGAGEVKELAVLNLRMPASAESKPAEMTLEATLLAEGDRIAQNAWRLWAVPPVTPLRPGWHRERGPRVARELTDGLLAHVRAGGSALLWPAEADLRYARPAPFWREAIHVFSPHALWERVPQAGYADMRFFSVATDFAIDSDRLRDLLGPDARCRHIWRRFDARAMTWSDYLIEAELGRGRMMVNTLRFEGGLGCQPDTFDANPMGAWMLSLLLESLA